jgi:hypothetical protein
MLSFPRRGYIFFLFAFILQTLESKGMREPGDSVPHPLNISFETLSGAAADSISAVIPFSRAGNLILVKAKADSIEGNFILDTGSPFLVLNITYFRDYPSEEIATEEQAGMNGTAGSVLQTMVREFSFGGIAYSHIKANLVDLGSIENNKGVKVFGLIGMQLFRQFEMIIDYDKNLIYLHRIAKKEAAVYRHEMLKDTSAYREMPIDIVKDRILANSEISGKKVRLMIDFAAESNVLDSRLSDKIFESIAITKRVVLNGVGNKKVDALYGDLSNMKIGGQTIATIPVLITNLEKTCLAYDFCIDGILGFDFLSLHKIGFNFVNRKMYIWK